MARNKDKNLISYEVNLPFEDELRINMWSNQNQAFIMMEFRTK